MENKEIQKPFILEIEEVKAEIIQAINNAINVRGIPFYILDLILSDAYGQVKDAAKAELMQAQAQMKALEQKAEEVA